MMRNQMLKIYSEALSSNCRDIVQMMQVYSPIFLLRNFLFIYIILPMIIKCYRTQLLYKLLVLMWTRLIKSTSNIELFTQCINFSRKKF